MKTANSFLAISTILFANPALSQTQMTGSEMSARIQSFRLHAGPESGIVGDGVEIPHLDQSPANDGLSLDFGPNSILLRQGYATTFGATYSGFYGVVIKDENNSLPDFFSVDLVSSDIQGFAQNRISLTADEIWLNLQGLHADAGDELLLSVSFGFVLGIAPSPNGTVTGGGEFQPGESTTLSADPALGFIFAGWTGDAAGTDNPLSITMDASKSIGAMFVPDGSDDDGDGLSLYQEVVVYNTDPTLPDTDHDSFLDGFEVSTGFSPTSATSTPDALSWIRTAIEFEFSAAAGQSYRIEGSTDAENWETVEEGIEGHGTGVRRFYHIQDQPHRFFRVRKE